MRKRDKIIFYLTSDKSFRAICEVTKEYFVDHSFIWEADDYPHRIGIEPLSVPQEPLALKKAREIAEHPDLGGSFGRCSVVQLKPEDFNIILNIMTSGELNQDKTGG